MIEDTTYENNVYVQHADCVVRAKCFSEVRYDVRLNMPRGEWYSGEVDVFFTVNELPSTDCFLDFRGVKIGDCRLNDSPIELKQSTFKNHHIALPSS